MITARIRGMESLRAELRLLAAEAPAMIDAAMKEAVEPVWKTEQSEFPRSPGSGGHAAAGFHAEIRRTNARGLARVWVGLREKLWYARFPEFGTSKMAGSGVVRRAFDTNADEVARRFADGIRKRVRKRGL